MELEGGKEGGREGGREEGFARQEGGAWLKTAEMIQETRGGGREGRREGRKEAYQCFSTGVSVPEVAREKEQACVQDDSLGRKGRRKERRDNKKMA